MSRSTARLLAGALVAISLGSPGRVLADAVTDVVITEVMYHPASGDLHEQFIELFNQSSTAAYSLKDWTFEEGVGFTFPDVSIGPRQYLVVCADQNRIRQIYGITNTVGDWDPASSLDFGGERIRLLDAAGVEIEDFTYDDRTPWPVLADGYDSSLEKRNPAGDNDDPANWAASKGGPSWTKVSVSGLATSSTLYIYLSAAGTAYVDDVKIYPLGNPGDNHVQNGDFETGAIAPWSPNGNHAGSSVTTENVHGGSKALKLVATGAGQTNTTAVVQASLGLVNNDPYVLELWTYIPDSSIRVIARLSGSGGAAEPIYVEAQNGSATPGRTNSVDTDDVPPFVYPVNRLPQAPLSTDKVTIQAIVADDHAVAGVTLHWDDGSGEKTAAMIDDGAHGDGAAGDGIWAAAIGPFATGKIVRYWVTATDDKGQTGRYPFEGSPTPNLGFYVEPPGLDPGIPLRSNSGYTSTGPAVYHLMIDPQYLTGNPPSLSNVSVYVPGTFIYNGEVFDNVRIRHRGQTSLGNPKKHWKVDFNKDHRFLTPFAGHKEVDNINIQSSYGDKTFLREYLSYKAWMDVGLPGLEMWHVRLYLNGAYRGFYIHLESPGGDWLRRTGKDKNGWLWKSYSDAKGGTGGFEIHADGGDVTQANAALGDFIGNMNSLTGQPLVDYINAEMDVPSFIDFLALHQLIMNCDHPAKNYLVYADRKQPDGTWTYYTWDTDLTHGRNYECSSSTTGQAGITYGDGTGVYNDTIRNNMFNDPQLLFGTQARPKCDGPWNGVINGFLGRTTAFRQRLYDRTDELVNRLYHPDVLIPLIEDLRGPLEAEVEKDWTLNPFQYGSRQTYVWHVGMLEQWVQDRYDYLENALSSLTAPDIFGLTCARSGANADLAWSNSGTYSALKVYRNGSLFQTLAASAVKLSVPLDAARTINTFRVSSVYNNLERTGESCTIVTTSGSYVAAIAEDFDQPAPPSELITSCDAAQVNGVLRLTDAVPDQVGTAFFRTKASDGDFIAEFDVRFEDPSIPGAEGLVFAMVRAASPDDLVGLCGSDGGGYGFFHDGQGGIIMPGYGVVFDTWQDSGEPSHNWAGFLDTNARTDGGAVEAVDVPEEFTANGTFHARVLGKNGTFTLLLSNSSIGMVEREVFTHTVPGFAAEDVYFGFTASTNNPFERHVVDNFVLQVSGSTPPAVTAAFHADVVSGEAPLTVFFVDDSTGATSRSWDFGDGGTSSQASPSHTYAAPGVYTVRLTATGPGGTDVEEKVGFITALAVLEADFSADVNLGPKPLVVNFTDRTRHNVPVVTYAWDFGDGAISALPNPSHTYASGGEFDVTLVVTAAGGLSSTKSRVKLVQVDDVQSADFTAAPLSGAPPLAVTFTDASKGATIRSWHWDFGDGVTSAEESPSHTYLAAGTYTVGLIVSGFQATASTEKKGLITVEAAGGFIRGDANRDGGVDLSDAIWVLAYLFQGKPAEGCLEAADSNDDGKLDISDAIGLLGYLFQGGAAPPAPFPDAGADPTPDALGCSGG